MSFRGSHHFFGFGFIKHFFHHNSSFGRFLKNLYCKFFPQPEPEPEPDPEPEAPAVFDLSSLDALIGTNVDSVDEATIQNESGDDYTAFMYEQGLLVPISNASGIITGFEFTAPDGVELDVIGTIGGDVITTDLGDNEISGRAGNDTLSGGEGNDTLRGGDNNDTLYGGADDDLLYGDAGNDTLYGEAGNDTLDAGAGLDNLFGGSGADTFVFGNDGLGTGIDIVRDFSISENDVLDLSDLLSGYDPDSATQSLADFVQITDNGTDSLISVDTNGGGNFEAVAIVRDTTGLADEQILVDNGTIIV